MLLCGSIGIHIYVHWYSMENSRNGSQKLVYGFTVDVPSKGDVEDLATLSKLDEDILLTELRTRYMNDDIYVSESI